MSVPIKTVCLINGSLRGRKAASLSFLRDVDRSLPEARYRRSIVTVGGNPKEDYPVETLRCMAAADALVFVFPLYGYGLPGALMRLLEEYRRFVVAGTGARPHSRVYAVINCGYPRPELTTGEAVRVLRNFCRRFSLNWRFAMCVGTGPLVVFTRKLPFLDRGLKRGCAAIAGDISADCSVQVNDVFVRPVVPESVIRRIKEHYEKKGGMIQSRGGPPGEGEHRTRSY